MGSNPLRVRRTTISKVMPVQQLVNDGFVDESGDTDTEWHARANSRAAPATGHRPELRHPASFVGAAKDRRVTTPARHPRNGQQFRRLNITILLDIDVNGQLLEP
jgi:hypothetical protein